MPYREDQDRGEKSGRKKNELYLSPEIKEGSSFLAFKVAIEEGIDHKTITIDSPRTGILKFSKEPVKTGNLTYYFYDNKDHEQNPNIIILLNDEKGTCEIVSLKNIEKK